MTVRTTERTLALIKPDGQAEAAEILQFIKGRGFHIVDRKTLVRLTHVEACEVCREYRGTEFFSPAVDHLMSGEVTVLVLERQGYYAVSAVQMWQHYLGAMDPVDAEPHTIRGHFRKEGRPVYMNTACGPSNSEDASRQIRLFFPKLAAAA